MLVVPLCKISILKKALCLAFLIKTSFFFSTRFRVHAACVTLNIDQFDLFKINTSPTALCLHLCSLLNQATLDRRGFPLSLKSPSLNPRRGHAAVRCAHIVPLPKGPAAAKRLCHIIFPRYPSSHLAVNDKKKNDLSDRFDWAVSESALWI